MCVEATDFEQPPKRLDVVRVVHHVFVLIVVGVLLRTAPDRAMLEAVTVQ